MKKAILMTLLAVSAAGVVHAWGTSTPATPSAPKPLSPPVTPGPTGGTGGKTLGQ